MTKRNENEIIAALTHMTVSGLKGTINHYTTYDSKGTTSKKIVIEYNVENNKRETA